MNQEKQIYNIEIYSDGGADPNPGKGGYGTILSWKEKSYRKEFCQGYKLTTNNRMELMGVIIGLEKLKNSSNVTVYTDSQYVVNGIEQGWAKRWQANNWFKNKKEKALNADLWEKLLELISQHEVKFIWVKGHNGHPENERCDSLATQALSSDTLIEDEGYYLQEDIKSDNTNGAVKIKKEGDLCRKCNTPVIKKTSRKKRKAGQDYYFEYYLVCPQCDTMYMVEEAKIFIDKSDSPQLF